MPILLIALVAILGVAAPVIGATPSPSPTNPAGKTPPGQEGKSAKGPETPITVSGTIAKATDADGRTTFTVSSGGKTYELSDGPRWFWGDNDPLAAYVGKTVEVKGTTNAGSTEIDVDTIDGKALRTEGRPPWAGGPKVVGAKHPGYQAWKAAHDGTPGNGLGHDKAPGQQKDKAGADQDEPTESEAPN